MTKSKRIPPNFDPGLGIDYRRRTKRIINKDGTFNIQRHGIKRLLYHRLRTMNNMVFYSWVIGFYLFINFVFACIYYICGIENIAISGPGLEVPGIILAFFFSMQTFTTVGFGTIFPNDSLTNFVAGIEAMTGLLFFAIATGLVYGRFSRPTIGIVPSSNMLVSPYSAHENGLMFRITGLRTNVLVDVEARVILVIDVDHTDHVQRKYIPLKLEMDNLAFLALSWTIVHPINKDSPLLGQTKEDLIRSNAEFLILIKSYDDGFGQHVHMRFSYIPEEIIWGAVFENNYFTDKDGEIHLHVEGISRYKDAVLV